MMIDFEDRIVQCVVPVSGGKDSQVCLELAIEEFGVENIVGLFCDTQYEHRLTYEHIKHMQKMYGVEIVTRTRGYVLDLVRRHGYFPNNKARFCTDELKLKVVKEFIQNLAKDQGQGFQVWKGMRTGESYARAKRYVNVNDGELYYPHEIMPSTFPKYLADLDIKFRLPIVDWTDQEVLEHLDGRENPLYSAGFNRVGCFPCLAGSDKQLEKSFNFDKLGAERWVEIQEIEEEIGVLVYRTQKGRDRNYPDDEEYTGCAYCRM